jgi:hypothetical protein
VLPFFEKDEMNKNDFFDEAFDFESDEERSSYQKVIRHRKPDGDDWDESPESDKRSKRKNRWRDIEDRLAKKALRDNSDWNYGNYDF